jgi:hypothetical protein
VNDIVDDVANTLCHAYNGGSLAMVVVRTLRCLVRYPSGLFARPQQRVRALFDGASVVFHQHLVRFVFLERTYVRHVAFQHGIVHHPPARIRRSAVG